jgi:hypothetical protein
VGRDFLSYDKGSVMDVKDIVAKINTVDAGLAEAKRDLMEFLKQHAGKQLTASAVQVKSPYQFDANQMLMQARQAAGGARIDPVVGPDCPYTVQMPTTKHVLSVARPDLGEMFMGYCMRVADQATNGKGDEYSGSIGSLFLGSEHLFKEFGGFDPTGANWPSAADKFYNMRAYMSVAERAKDDAAQQQWAAWDTIVLDRIKREREQSGTAGAPPNMPNQPDGTALPPGETPL